MVEFDCVTTVLLIEPANIVVADNKVNNVQGGCTDDGKLVVLAEIVGASQGSYPGGRGQDQDLEHPRVLEGTR